MVNENCPLNLEEKNNNYRAIKIYSFCSFDNSKRFLDSNVNYFSDSKNLNESVG